MPRYGVPPQGNLAGGLSDYQGVGCDGYREALSARLDGEEEPDGRAAVDAHLAACPDCRRWFDDAAAVTRLARTGPAVAGADVVGAVLPAAPGRWRGRLLVTLRVALGVLGLAQLGLGVLQLVAIRSQAGDRLHGSTVDGATPGHLWHESAAWNLAVGAAFVWAATRRGRPAGIVPILTVFVGALAVLSTVDIVVGRVEVPRVASHGFVLAGYVIVLLLSGSGLDTTPPDRRAGATRPAWRGRWRTRRPAPSGTVLPFPGRGRDEPAARTRRRGAA